MKTAVRSAREGARRGEAGREVRGNAHVAPAPEEHLGWLLTLTLNFDKNTTWLQAEVVLREAGGKAHQVQHWSISRSGRDGPATFTFRIGAPAGTDWKELVLRFPMDVHHDTVPFEFKDVPIK